MSELEQVNTAEAPSEAPSFSYSDEYANLVTTKGFNSADDVLKSYANLESTLGERVKIPGEDASPEERDAFLTKLGRPEAADKYDLGDALQNVEPEVVSQFNEIAYKLGLSNEQAKALVEFEASLMPSQEVLQAELEEYNKSAESELKEIWGKDYDENIKATRKVLADYESRLNNDSMKELLEVAGNNPALRVMLADIADSYKEKPTIDGSASVRTPEQAKAEIASLRGDSEFMAAYQQNFHPGHKEAVAKLTKLYKEVHG